MSNLEPGVITDLHYCNKHMVMVLSSACRAGKHLPLHKFVLATPEISMPVKRKATVLHVQEWTLSLSNND